MRVECGEDKVEMADGGGILGAIKEEIVDDLIFAPVRQKFRLHVRERTERAGSVHLDHRSWSSFYRNGR